MMVTDQEERINKTMELVEDWLRSDYRHDIALCDGRGVQVGPRRELTDEETEWGQRLAASFKDSDHEHHFGEESVARVVLSSYCGCGARRQRHVLAEET